MLQAQLPQSPPLQPPQAPPPQPDTALVSP
jgi:hypothetical protein